MLSYIFKSSKVKILNSKTFAALFILLIFSFRFNQPYLEYVKEKNYPMGWCIFPFFLDSYLFLTIFYALVIYMHSDAPFMQHEQMYQIIRTGRTKWAVGQIGGIFFRSLTITVVMAVFAALPFAGRLEFSTGWGKMIYTLASERPYSSDSLYSKGLYFRFIYTALQRFSPLELMAIALSVCTLICTFLGLLLFLVSLLAGKSIALGVCFTEILLIYLVENQVWQSQQLPARLVPCYWAEIALLDYTKSGFYRLPSLFYIYTALLTLITVMAILIVIRIKRMEFFWENEDA